MTRVLIIRADNIRHRALATRLKQLQFDVASIVQHIPNRESQLSKQQVAHFKARGQFEFDYFRYLETSRQSSQRILLETSDINSGESLNLASKFEPAFVITFGCSILNEKWIGKFSDQILGIHLGLSPYYRGQGTNFFPFVNDELGAVGYTLMNLDQGVDTGHIVHQKYADFVQGDSIHSVGSRLIQSMFEDIGIILKTESSLGKSTKQSRIETSKVYRGLDFTEEALERALINIRNGMIDAFIENQELGRKNFPILKASYLC